MSNTLRNIFSNPGFMPHIHCYLNRPPLVWTMFVTDLLIGIAYAGIAFMLWGLIRKVRIQFNLIIFCFGIFILACGFTHLMSDWTLWYPDYWWSAFVNTITAIASIGTGAYLWRLRYSLLSIAEVAKLSEKRRIELEELNRQLNINLSERETRYRNTFENVAIGLANVSLKGQWLQVNKKLCKITGYSEQELLSKTIMEITHPEDQGNDIQLFRKVKQGRISEYSLEKRYIRKNGSVVWVKVGVNLSRDSSRKPEYLLVSIDDISERKKLELQTEEFKYALDTSSILAITNQDGTITYANQKFCEISQYKREELIGQNHRILNSGYHSKEFFTNLWATISSGKVWRGEICNRAKNGCLYWVDTVIVPHFNPKQNYPSCYIAIRNDITQRKLLELELREAIRSRDEFISVASHELKTPITSIRLHMQMLSRLIQLNPVEALDFNRIWSIVGTSTAQLDRLTRLVEDMLDVSREITGKLNFKFKEEDLSKITEETIMHFQEQCENPCKIHIDVQPKIRGIFDRLLIEQMLLNLLSNALKYGQGKPIEVTLKKQGEDLAVLCVRDFGLGIPKEAQCRIFERFERAISEINISGLGLGLYIVKKVLEAHHADIHVESTPGKGALFTVILRLWRTDRSQSHAA